MRRKEKLLKGKPLGYNQIYNFMFDNTLMIATGFRALDSQAEVNKYYPNTIVPSAVAGYVFDNVMIHDMELSSDFMRCETTQTDIELSKRIDVQLNIGNVSNITLEYKKSDAFLGINIFDTRLFKYDVPDTIQLPLTGDYSGYAIYRSKWDGENQYYSIVYHVGNWAIEASEYRKTDVEDPYTSGQKDWIPDHKTMLKTKDEMIQLIDHLQIRENAEKWIVDMGLKITQD